MIKPEEDCWWALTVAATPPSNDSVYEAVTDEPLEGAVSYSEINVLARVYLRELDGDTAVIELGGLGGETKEVPRKQLRPHPEAGWITVTESTEDAIKQRAKENAHDGDS